ncbi:hypothetical protein AM500_13000 [Bacillus sp. FJAT-18017]|uniref:DNA phosphorothioation-dependent restriction protein DptF n=1 Tax=Bacillus sp. FJAT-18017 TaxID=1705566 RepID=UPI0006B058AC|nr:DNA phosphorothioation-dependent restriction protein DptF [Bacillus sp. FJAT-18017]ALC90600.1 hypothetical protein AM500_13000 [Bacillus sp. FJAT-18017]
MSQNYFLDFLEDLVPEAASSAKKMEELLFEDPSSSVIKARLFAENILGEVFKFEGVEIPYQATFYDKINLLAKEDFLPAEIQRSFDTIRLIGNKAAHDPKFNDITEAFKLHKEMHKLGVWFTEVYSLKQIQVNSYEPPKPPKKENVAEIVKNQIFDLLGPNIFETLKKSKEEKPEEEHGEEKNHNGETTPQENSKSLTNNILTKNLGLGESYLVREIKRLRESSQEAIENASQFSKFKDYLHVKRNIQEDLENILERNKNRDGANLILLCGSVGDGKSHLLAYLKKKRPDLIDEYTIFNDATESFSPNKNSLETLEEILSGFSDQHYSSSNDKVILAINMGVLHNFINAPHNKFTYNQLSKFVDKSDLFSQNITTHYSEEVFDLLSFGDYHAYELTSNGPISTFYSTLIEKIVNSSSDNPFYLALLEDEKNNITTMVHENYKMLSNKNVQEQVVQLVIQTIVQKKLVISARAFLNFISDILIPDNLQNVSLLTDFEKLNYSLSNLLFDRKERSFILQAISDIDPIHIRSSVIDGLVIELNTITDWDSKIREYIQDQVFVSLLKPFLSRSDLTEHSFNLFFESFIRISFLTNKEFANELKDISYINFLKNLYYFNSGDKRKIRAFYDEMKSAIFKWKGSPKKDYIYLDKPSEKYRLAQKLELCPSVDHLITTTNDVLNTFKSSIILAYHGGDSSKKILLEIDFQLYELLFKVQNGYRPNKRDEEDAIKFVEFLEKLMNFGEKQKELLIVFPKDKRFYTIKRDSFDAFVFERE